MCPGYSMIEGINECRRTLEEGVSVCVNVCVEKVLNSFSDTGISEDD